MVDSAWWLRIATPDPGPLGSVDVYPLGDAVEEGEVERIITACRAEHGVPDNAVDLPGWDVSITSGPLHRDLVDGFAGTPQRPATPPATVHDTAPGA